MEMRNIAAKLKSLQVEISDSFLVHFVLNSLPLEYDPFKISYNTHDQKWTVNELLTKVVQEEERLKHEKPDQKLEVAHHVFQKGEASKGGQKKNYGALQGKKKIAKKPTKQTVDPDECFFCKKPGHMKRNCYGYKNWLAKRGLSPPKEAEEK